MPYYKFHRRRRRYRAAPLHVQRRFILIARYQARICPDQNHRRSVCRHSRLGAKGLDVAQVEVAPPHNGNRSPRPRSSRAIERIEIVDRGKIGREQVMRASGRILRLHTESPPRCNLRPSPKIVERNHAAHHAAERRRNLRVFGIRQVLRPIHTVAVNPGVKDLRHLTRRPGKNHQPVARRNFIHRESVPFEPRDNARQILRAHAEARAVLSRRQPVMKER